MPNRAPEPELPLNSAVHRIHPSTFLFAYLASILTLSFSYMYYFCRYFGFTRWLTLIHLSVELCLMILLVLAAGLPLRFDFFLRRRLTRVLIAVSYAAFCAALGLLYVLDFVANRLWGANLNYAIVSHYVLTRQVLENASLALPA